MLFVTLQCWGPNEACSEPLVQPDYYFFGILSFKGVIHDPGESLLNTPCFYICIHMLLLAGQKCILLDQFLNLYLHFSHKYIISNTQCSVLLYSTLLSIQSLKRWNCFLSPMQHALWLHCILLLRPVSVEKLVSLPLKWWISPCMSVEYQFKMINLERSPCSLILRGWQ